MIDFEKESLLYDIKALEEELASAIDKLAGFSEANNSIEDGKNIVRWLLNCIENFDSVPADVQDSIHKFRRRTGSEYETYSSPKRDVFILAPVLDFPLKESEIEIASKVPLPKTWYDIRMDQQATVKIYEEVANFINNPIKIQKGDVP